MPSWREARDALYAWATETCGCPAIWARRNGPRPNPPYVTLDMIGGPPLSGLHHTHPDAVGDVLSSGEQELTLSLQAIGEGAMGRVLAFGASIERPRLIEILDRANLVAVDAGGPIDVSALLGSEWEERAAIDVRVRLPFEARDFVGWIESVELTGTVLDAVGNVAVSRTQIIEGKP